MAGSTYAGFSIGSGMFRPEFRPVTPNARPGIKGPAWTQQYAAHESLKGKMPADKLTRTKKNILTGQGFGDIALSKKYGPVRPGYLGMFLSGPGSVAQSARRNGSGLANSVLNRPAWGKGY